MKSEQPVSINPANSVFVVVDVENEFCKPGGARYTDTSARLMPTFIPNLTALVEKVRAEGKKASGKKPMIRVSVSTFVQRSLSLPTSDWRYFWRFSASSCSRRAFSCALCSASFFLRASAMISARATISPAVLRGLPFTSPLPLVSPMTRCRSSAAR